MQSSVTQSNPSLWKLLGALKKEEALSQLKRAEMDRGDSAPMKKRYKAVNARLKNLIENYNPEEKKKFLTSVAHNIAILE